MSEDCTTAFAWTSSTTSYFGTMAKVRQGSDILKPFSGKGDVVAWLKKVRLVVRLQHVDSIATLLPLYLEGDALALYMKMKEEDQKDIDLIKARLKEVFTDSVFTAYRKLAIIGRLVTVSMYMPTKSGSWLDWLGLRELDWTGS